MDFERIIAVRNSKTVFKDGGRVIKTFGKSYSKSDVLSEALNLAIAEEAQINFQKLSEVIRTDGRWALVLDYIGGETLDRMIFKNPDKADYYLEKFVEFQLSLMNVTARFEKISDKARRKIKECSLDENLKNGLLMRLDELSDGESVCHGDYSPDNVIFGDDGKLYAIDWAHAAVGSPCTDAASTYLGFVLSGEKNTGKQYIKLFCAMSGEKTEEIKKYLPIAALLKLHVSNECQRQVLLKYINDAV